MADSATDRPFMVPSVGSHVAINGETYLVTHVYVSDERVTDDKAKGRHYLKVHFAGYWDEEGYRPSMEETL